MTLRMTYDPGRHHSQSIRLKGYDYAQAGAYFVTVCTQNRQCIFGHIVGAAACGHPEMVLNEAGRMLQAVWDELQVFYLGVQTDGFVVMPNHVHGIIMLTGRPVRLGPHVGAGPRACPDYASPDIVADRLGQAQAGQPQGVAPTLALSDVVLFINGLPLAVAGLNSREMQQKIDATSTKKIKKRRARKNHVQSDVNNWLVLVGTTGFEPATPASRMQCSTRLSHVPTTIS